MNALRATVVDAAEALVVAGSYGLIYAGVTLLSWAALGGAVVVVLWQPQLCGVAAVSALVGFRVGHRRRHRLEMENDLLGDGLDAVKLADMRRDRNFVRITGEQPAVGGQP